MAPDDHARPFAAQGNSGREAIDGDVGERAQSRRRPPPILITNEWAVSAGAVFGVWARFAIGDYAAHHVAVAFPAGTLAINLLGCLLIGGVQTLFLDLLAIRRELQLFLAVGMLGGFTTFSTFSVEMIQLLEGGRAGRALTYLALSLVGGPFAVLAGIVLTRGAFRAFSVQRRRAQ